MNLRAVMTEINGRLHLWQGVTGYDWAAPRIAKTPASLVTLPANVDLLQAYQNGMVRVRDMIVILAVSRASERGAIDTLSAYCATSGVKSLPARLEDRTYTWTTCDTVTVVSIDFPDLTIGDTPYLAAAFHLDITGHG